MRILRILLSLAVALSIAAAQSSKSIPKNIILFIADGMGVAHVTAGRTHKGWLEIEKFKHIGLILTHGPGDFYVTESAAAATAFATGHKIPGGIISLKASAGPRTFIDTLTIQSGGVSMAPDSTPLRTVFEAARDNKLKTGAIVVCTITDATPAAFLSHAPSRRMHAEIAEQIANSNADVLFGGGRQWFLPTVLGGRREDGKNLIQEMTGRGYTYVSNDTSFHALDVRRANKIVGLFAENHMGYAEQRILSVAEMTKAALEFFSNDDTGFFLLVENEGSDDAAHSSLSDRVKVEIAELDNAVEEATRFAQRNPETLILVAGDHETGGYALNNGSLTERTIQGGFTTKDHTASMIPIFAMGPGAERFTGIIDNTTVGKILLEFVQAKH